MKTLSIALVGLDAHVVHIHALPDGSTPLEVVGLSEAHARETGVRIRSALHQIGVDMGASHVAVRVTSDVPLRSVIDLAVAVAVLGVLRRVSLKPLQSTAILGELSLAGMVRRVRGVLPALRGARAQGITRAIVPLENARAASRVAGMTVHVVEHLGDLLRYLAEGIPLTAAPKPSPFTPSAPSLDMADLPGMAGARRALEVAAAGKHNLLLVGSPGAGKTMLARRLAGLLPPLTEEEAIEATSVHSVAGLTSSEVGILTSRPFRAPHHTVSCTGLVGGGDPARPGEVSLAHNGVLFLDELLEFQRSAIESLGYVLEEGKVTTSRGGQSATFPAQPMLVGAINPCGCGYRGARSRTCSCSPERVQKYIARLQDRMFDRFDMRFCLPAPEMSEMVGAEPGESSSCVQKRVVAARAFHAERFGEPRRRNAELTMSETDRVVALDDSASATLGSALSSRERARVLGVARTIADLAGSETVRAMHVEEALVYAVPSHVRTG